MNWKQRLVGLTITQAMIEKETEKAILINGIGWIPKSQSYRTVYEGNPIMVLPLWLALKLMPKYNAWENELTEDEVKNIFQQGGWRN